jgi:hypothetical protein
MRYLLILGGIGMLSAAAWMATSNADAAGHGSAHGSHGHAGLEEGSERHVSLHQEMESNFFPGEPELTAAFVDMILLDIIIGEAAEGGPQHLFPGHLIPGHLIPGHGAGPVSHHHAHVLVQAHSDQGSSSDQDSSLQPTAHHGGESDDVGAATAQPDPTANPSIQPPPGATGPGWRMSGRPGPGRPGPGWPTRQR